MYPLSNTIVLLVNCVELAGDGAGNPSGEIIQGRKEIVRHKSER